jgi:hypothetical protein
MSALRKRRCQDADLSRLSADDVRKGLAEILAEMSCTQYEIMTIPGPPDAKTSQVCTHRVERWTFAKSAIERAGVSHGCFGVDTPNRESPVKQQKTRRSGF